MKYDATLKKVFQRPPNLLLSHALGEKVVVKQILPSEMITIGNLHPDLLFETEEGAIIHTELHGYPMANFAVRNLIYFGLILRDYCKPPTQVVFWIGAGDVGVPEGLDIPGSLQYRYHLIDVRQLDAELLFASPDTGEAIFGILCKLKDQHEAVQRILRRIASLPASEQREALAELLILSGLRGLTELVNTEARTMPITIDIHENSFLEGIFQDGRSTGKQEGRQEGRQEGLQQALRDTLLRNLHQKFGTIPADVSSAIATAEVATLERWNSRVIPSSDLTSVFE